MTDYALSLGWAAVVYDLALAIFHALFWKLFGWPASLAPSGRVNSAITQTLNVMITYVFIFYAAGLAWTFTLKANPSLLLLAGAGFWLLRAALQPTLFALRPPIARGLLSVWLIGAALHLAPVLL